MVGNKKQTLPPGTDPRAIDAALEEKPKDFEELLKKLEAAGIEVNRERKYLRFRLSPEDRYTRCDTPKGDYTEQAIKERITGARIVKPRRTSPQKPVSKVGLLVDIEAAIRSGKGPGYERWAKVFNLKQLSQAVIYLKEHGDMSYEDLQEKSDAVTAGFNALSVQIKELESQMAANGGAAETDRKLRQDASGLCGIPKSGYKKNSVRHMRRKSFCIKRRRNILTRWESQSRPPSKLCERNMPGFWNRNGKPTLLISRPGSI